MANSLQLFYQDEEHFQQFIEENELAQYPTILIQAYVCQLDKEQVEKLRRIIVHYLPQAVVVGCNSSGEIVNGVISDKKQIVLSFTTFDKTNVNSALYILDTEEDSRSIGKRIVKDLVNSETKALILFTSFADLYMNQLLDEIYSTNPELPIAGGAVTDVSTNGMSIVLTESEVTNKGVAVVALDNHDLTIQTMVNSEWQEVGRKFTITNAKGKDIYKLNGQKPLQILRHYLGNSFIERLPQSGSEFPLIIKRDGEQIVCFIRKIGDKGVLELSEEIYSGDEITFAIVDIEKLANVSYQHIRHIQKQPIEAIFAYHCISRKKSIESLTIKELDSLNKIAPVSGIFCSGEIAKKKGEPSKVFAHSLTYLAISEMKIHRNKVNVSPFQLPEDAHLLVTLTNLINASAADIKELNQNKKISDEHYRSLFENNSDIVYSTDLKGNFTSVNPSFTKVIGYSSEELLGKSAIKFVQDFDIQRVKRHFSRTISGKTQFYDLEIKTKMGNNEYYQIKNIPITVNDECVGVYGIGRNITENLKFEEKITQLAFYDEETGLPNRTKFIEILEDMLKRAKKKSRSISVLFVDLDRFKLINDTLGHNVGDILLKELADRIKATIPNGAYLGRFNSDKFTILLTKQSNPDKIIHICQEILNVIQIPFVYEKKEFFITANIGISMYPYDGSESTELLKNADIALSRAKFQVGNDIVFYSDDMNSDAIQRVELESDLRRALKNNELYLAYQPIVESSSQRLKACEALIRWEHPIRGSISPLEFIPLAEETGLIHAIGKWVLKTACKQLKAWHEKGITDMNISVNVSAYQFQNRWFIEDVKNALAFSGLHPGSLQLELTETVMVNDSLKTIEIMQLLSDLGVKISIDDFGTGYSSLSYLRNLPIHILKIDRSFIQNLDTNTPDYAIVKSIMTMGHGLGLEITAEGVETEQQRDLLEKLGCNFVQGYYIEKPLKAELLEKWLSVQTF